MTIGNDTIKPHVAVLPSPGMGHLIPLLEFSKHLMNHHNVYVSFLVITTDASAAQRHLLDTAELPNDLHIINLPPADVSSLVTNDMSILTRISLVCQESLKNLGSVLMEINLPKALIIDNFVTDAFLICKELNVPVYTFYTCPTKSLALGLYLPQLDKEVDCEFVDLLEPIQVPGCKPFCVDDLQDSLRNRKGDGYKWSLQHASRLRMATGIFVNTWDDLESKSSWLKGINNDPFYRSLPAPPVYPVGPLIKHDEPVAESDAYILSWLDDQPNDSVLLVALGSGGTLTSEQLTELALGLEMSNQKFIFLVRKPSDVTTSGTFFNIGSNTADDPVTYLPQGFINRTRGVGLVVPSWAPQVPVLRHKATGGFLSHCGWNSTLESIVHGVPMIAWPLYAEQRMNATLLAEEVAVAVKPVGCLKGGKKVVERDEVERVVRLVMEGEEGKVMRSKANELKESAVMAIKSGGSSYNSVSCVVESWK